MKARPDWMAFLFLISVSTACDVERIYMPCSIGGVRLCHFHRNYLQGGACVGYEQCGPKQYMHREALVDGGGYLVRAQICRDYTDCGEDEFLEYDGTVYEKRDNICMPRSGACAEGEYQSVAPTATSDRTCAKLTVCGEGEFESQAPTEVSDRVCTNRTACVEGEQFVSNSYSADADTECQDYAVCAPGYGVTVQGTALSDRQCALCEAGKFVSHADGPGFCQWCPERTFAPGEGQADACQPHTQCAGFDYAFAGNATHDATCMARACPDSWRRSVLFEQDGVTFHLCAQCNDGYYAVGDDCALCPANHYCPTYLNQKIACAGVVEYNGGAVAVPSSPPGSTGRAACSCDSPGFYGVAESIQGCQRCKDGTYSNGSSQGCAACPGGHYVETSALTFEGGELVVNVGCLPCPEDRPFTHGNAHSQSECMEYGYCEEGYFWDQGAARCSPCSACGDLRFEAPCGVQSDTVCGPCGPISWLRTCEPGYELPRCNEDDCVPCTEVLPTHAEWHDQCRWRCAAGFYEVVGLDAQQCVQCGQECVKPGLTRVPCTAHADASCGAPCKNLSKPLLWSRWVASNSSNCGWECLEGRLASWSDETGIYTCTLA